ncbi:MAG: thymidine phosphorylase [Clostridia bacterium]|nr:thymidine phosphorylase [Clostridia bacterium]
MAQSFQILDILRKKRFGQELSELEIRAFVRGVTEGTIPDYQIAALLMAICINGMTDRETLALTMEMTRSGDVLDLSDIEGVKADKHSTGGVGDTTSLILVPLVASCGVKMAKMSGRGLGFTGGTLDKLESIPGMNIEMSVEDFKSQLRRIGCAIIGQTADLAPADKVLYALRDVTSTVDCLPLIVSSILSKKMAAGCDVDVLDVKSGSGAIMDTPERSRELAETMVRIGNLSGKRFSALITNMDQPLGMYIGNALEVREAIEILSGRAAGDLKEVSLQLGAHILKNARAVGSVDEGVRMLEEKIANGEGLRKLAEMIEAQGGDPKVVNDPTLLPCASRIISLKTETAGWITAFHTADIGNAARLLGAGRMKKTDVLDLAAGIIMKVRLGDRVERGDILCELHAGAGSDVTGAYNLLLRSIVIGDSRPVLRPLIQAVVEE